MYGCNAVHDILTRKGVLLSQEDEIVDFYSIIAENFEIEGVTKSECQAKIVGFIRDNKFQFKLFLPAHSNWTKNATKDLLQDIQVKGDLLPSPREIHAAAELLQREIHLIQFSENAQCDTDKFSVTVFSPEFKHKLSFKGDGHENDDNQLTPLLLFLVKNFDGSLQFSKITGDTFLCLQSSFPA